VATIALVATMEEKWPTAVSWGSHGHRQHPPDPPRRDKAGRPPPRCSATTWAVLGLAVFHNVTTAVDDGLTLSLYLLTPWTIVNLYDYFFCPQGQVRDHRAREPQGPLRRLGMAGHRRLRGRLCRGGALLGSVVLRSPVAKATNGLDITFIVELLVSGVLYVIFARSIDLSGDAQAIEASNAKLIQLGISSPRSDRTGAAPERHRLLSSGELVR